MHGGMPHTLNGSVEGVMGEALWLYALVEFFGSHVLKLGSVLPTWIPKLTCLFHSNALWSSESIIMSLLMPNRCPDLEMAFKKLVRLRI